MKCVVILFFFGFCLCGSSVWAAPKANAVLRLGLDECTRLALEHSVAIRNAEDDLAISDLMVKQARAEALPQVSVEGYYRRLDEVEEVTIGDVSTEAGSLDSFNIDFRLEQLLWSSGRVKAALSAAKVNEAYVRWRRTQADQSVLRDVRLAFFDLLLKEQTVEVQERSIQLFERLRSEAEKKYKQGTVSEFDLIRARVRLANERPHVINSRNAYNVGLREFARLLNDERERVGAAGPLRPAVVTNDLAQFTAEALSNRPSLKMLALLVELNELDAAATRARTLPRFSAYLNYNGANSFQFADFENDMQWHWSGGLVASWSVWDGGLTRARVMSKRHEANKARTVYRDAIRQVKLEVQREWLNYQAALEGLKAAVGARDQAERAHRIAETGYTAGVNTYLQTVDAAQALRAAELSYLQAVRGVNAAVARLMFVSGKPASVSMVFQED